MGSYIYITSYIAVGYCWAFDDDVDDDDDHDESMARLGRLQKVTEGRAWLGSAREVAEGHGRESMARLGRLQKVTGGSSASRSPSIF